MTARANRRAFCEDVIDKVRVRMGVIPDHWMRPLRRPGADVVARGIRRVQGGQHMPRPQGITPELHAQINAADGALDADLLGPMSADALLQVGMFGRVMYRWR